MTAAVPLPERLRRHEAAYRRAREVLVALGDDDPVDRFCTDLERDVEDVAEAESGSGLFFVLAARSAFRRVDYVEAARLAAMAMAKDQRDLYAQKLWLAARAGKPPATRVAADPALADRLCTKPFEEFETRANGDVHTCCSAWMPLPIGSIESSSAEEVWNSPAAQAIRRSVLDGDFTWCSRLHCPKITGDTLPKRVDVTSNRHRRLMAERRTRLDRGPRRVMLSHDRSCNLACPSCRTETIVGRKDEQERLNRLVERSLFPLLAEAERVKVTGSGDPFGSGHFRWVLRELGRPDLAGAQIELQTNGVLCDRRAWEELRLAGRVRSVWVSLDAGCEETYRVVRRGGDWGRLMENLAFLAELRAAGEIGELRLDFVVQAGNFREMTEVVMLARRLPADGVSFQMIRNWGTFSVAEYRAHHVGAYDHPRFEELLEVLRDPRLHGTDVDLGNLRPLLRPAAGA